MDHVRLRITWRLDLERKKQVEIGEFKSSALAQARREAFEEVEITHGWEKKTTKGDSKSVGSTSKGRKKKAIMRK